MYGSIGDTSPMRLKTRALTQHGGRHGWLEERDSTEFDLCCDGWSMPPSQTDRTACPGLEMLKGTQA